jgi:hypothetical protein
MVVLSICKVDQLVVVIHISVYEFGRERIT